MQKSTLDTDFSYRLFGSEKSKLIDSKSVKICEANLAYAKSC